MAGFGEQYFQYKLCWRADSRGQMPGSKKRGPWLLLNALVSCSACIWGLTPSPLTFLPFLFTY